MIARPVKPPVTMLTNLALNVPLFLAALKIKGKRFIWRTIVGTLLLSLWLYILPLVDLTDGDYVLAAIFGGCIGGVGMFQRSFSI